MASKPRQTKILSTTQMQASVSVAQAKANLSALLTWVESKNSRVTIMRRGIPIAQLVPLPDVKPVVLRGSMAGTGRELGDIVSPYLAEWSVD